MSLKQELFDRISKHLLKQNERSAEHIGGACRYRGDNGLKCAVGAIIPDEKYSEYSEHIEGVTVYYKYVISCLPVRYRGKSSIDFLNKLQKLHDRTAVHLWKDGLKEIAKDEGLVVNF